MTPLSFNFINMLFQLEGCNIIVMEIRSTKILLYKWNLSVYINKV